MCHGANPYGALTGDDPIFPGMGPIAALEGFAMLHFILNVLGCAPFLALIGYAYLTCEKP